MWSNWFGSKFGCGPVGIMNNLESPPTITFTMDSYLSVDILQKRCNSSLDIFVDLFIFEIQSAVFLVSQSFVSELLPRCQKTCDTVVDESRFSFSPEQLSACMMTFKFWLVVAYVVYWLFQNSRASFIWLPQISETEGSYQLLFLFRIYWSKHVL